jgi:acid phosphatase (class A)
MPPSIRHTLTPPLLVAAALMFAGCDAGPAAKKPDEKTAEKKPAEKKPDEKKDAPTPDAPPVDVLVTDVPEEFPGYLIGYLTKEQRTNSLALLPPPPAKDSAMQAADEAASKAAYALKGTPRWDQAALDAGAEFPAATDTFSCALGVQISPTDTPNLYRLMRRSWMDGMMSGSVAKKEYKRERPFAVHKEVTCRPADEEELKHDPSYPSGHTAMGWAWALILIELAPDRMDQLLMRGYTYGLSRMICNAHWQTDTLQGRLLGAGTVARLHARVGVPRRHERGQAGPRRGQGQEPGPPARLRRRARHAGDQGPQLELIRRCEHRGAARLAPRR